MLWFLLYIRTFLYHFLCRRIKAGIKEKEGKVMGEEQLKFIVKRIDDNIASTNAKLLVLLGVNIFMISGFVVNYFQLEAMIKTSFWTEFWSVVSFFGMLISCLISLAAILPVSKDKASLDEKSGFSTPSKSKKTIMPIKPTLKLMTTIFWMTSLGKLFKYLKYQKRKN